MSHTNRARTSDPTVTITLQAFVCAVGGLTLGFALYELAGIKAAWVLVLVGVSLIATLPKRYLGQSEWEKLLERLRNAAVAPVTWFVAGAILLLAATVYYFPSLNSGYVFSGVAAVLLLINLLLLLRTRKPVSLDPPGHPATTTTAADSHQSPSEEFRRQVTRILFHRARRASSLNFGVTLAYFIVGVGVFMFVAYAVYDFFFSTDENLTGFTVSRDYLSSLAALESSELTPQAVLLALLLPLGTLLPIAGLMLLAWIAARFIGSATRLSRRQVIQETLSELGPLQSVLAGIPPRKPISDVVEQSLRHARRSFLFRSWIGILLFVVGTTLFVWLALDGILNGFENWQLTAAVGGSGAVSLIFSLVVNSQRESRETLEQIVKLEQQIADHAQRVEANDRLIARLTQDAIGESELKQVTGLLSLGSEPPNQALTTLRSAPEES